MRKRYFFIPLAVIIIITGVLVWACKHPYEAGIPRTGNILGEDTNLMGALVGSGDGINVGNYTLPKNSLSQDEQYMDYDPLFNYTVLFPNGKIPALTVSSNGVILAAAGDGYGKVLVKRSSDMGKTWTDSQVSSVSGSNSAHPFFINGYNDSEVLLGITGMENQGKLVTFYKTENDGETWQKSTEVKNLNKYNSTPTNYFITYGQGITLRHGNNASLMFPYFYSGYTEVTNGTGYTAIMRSDNDGNKFNSVVKKVITTSADQFGSFNTYETKLIELSDGKVLLNMRTAFGIGSNEMYWFLSGDRGETWSLKTKLKEEPANAKHADLVRYEFNGKPIKGKKYALMVHSYRIGEGYTVKLTDNDFNNGEPGSKYLLERELLVKGSGYPAITVLPDGTIATLTEENMGIVFRRFNLFWLTYEEEVIDYVSIFRY